MRNKEYLEEMKKGTYREQLNSDEWEKRQVIALEIIAENLITANENLTHIGNELTTIKNLIG